MREAVGDEQHSSYANLDASKDSIAAEILGGKATALELRQFPDKPRPLCSFPARCEPERVPVGCSGDVVSVE